MLPYFEPLQMPLGPDLTLRASGVGAVLGVALGHGLAVRRARRLGLDTDVFHRALAWIAVGALAGGHLGYLVFYEPLLLAESPRSVLRFWEGQASLGGFLACGLLACLFFALEDRRRARESRPPLDRWRLLDCLLLGATLAWLFARLGCFAIHDHPGSETRFWLGVRGICPEYAPETACHDLGLYEALWALVTLAALPRLARDRAPGFLAGAVVFGYGAVRFGVEFLRGPHADPSWLGLSPGHYGAVALLAVGAWILWGRGAAAVGSPGAS